MKRLQGIGGAPGYQAGTAAVFVSIETGIGKRAVQNIEAEIENMESSRRQCCETLDRLINKTRAELGEAEAEIFMAYQEILMDEVFFSRVRFRIRAERLNAEYLIDQERALVEDTFLAMENDYIRERAADINNVCMDLIAAIQGKGSASTSFSDALGDELIVVARDLTPADTIHMDKSRMKGIVTARGGATSHTVILAKILGIPVAVGVAGLLEEVRDGDAILVDGDTGRVVVHPDEQTLTYYRECQEKEKAREAVYRESGDIPAITLDGEPILVTVNISGVSGISGLDSEGWDGVGLFRTEYLYMSHDTYPTEEEQLAAYRSAAEKTGDKELVIRTLDIGGDKQLKYMDMPVEDNPFLGRRGIRLCLSRPEMFKVQLRAILRAGVWGNIKILLPMITNMAELIQAKALLAEAADELDGKGIPCRRDLPVGIMVETPAAVLLSDKLAEEADFFSIGTNDLTQYITAADRMNENVQEVCDCCNISVLRAIYQVCRSAGQQGIPVSICGESATDSRLLPLWAAMGVHEVNAAPSQVWKAKHIIRGLSKSELQKDLEYVLSCGEVAQVKAYLEKFV